MMMMKAQVWLGPHLIAFRETTGFRARGRDARRVDEEPPSAGVAGSRSARLMTTSGSAATR
jgi:hypothetical protein